MGSVHYGFLWEGALTAISFDSPYESNVLSFIVMSTDIAVSHWTHQTYIWTHEEYNKSVEYLKHVLFWNSSKKTTFHNLDLFNPFFFAA